MANYRCYCLDRFGCIRAVTAIAADSDERAQASAAVLLTTCAHEKAEIWDGRRRVCTIDGALHGEVRGNSPLRRARVGAAPRDKIAASAPRDRSGDQRYI